MARSDMRVFATLHRDFETGLSVTLWRGTHQGDLEAEALAHLTPIEAEQALFDLHSISTTLRGHQRAPKRSLREKVQIITRTISGR